MKRVVVISDLHCGSRCGLTPPGWQYSYSSSDKERQKFAKIQFEMWDWFSKEMDSLKPIDILIGNGDLIDGKGEKSGGIEQLESDRNKQVEIAAECIKYTEAKSIYLIRGTPYHTGKSEDFENNVAKEVKAKKIGNHEWYDVMGLVFDVKHFITRSIIPHGRHTAISRENLFNMIWNEVQQQPRADIFIRAHVHYYTFCGYDNKLMITLPSLQAYKTKIVQSISNTKVDIGFVSFDIESKEEYSWKAHLLNPVYQAAKALKI